MNHFFKNKKTIVLLADAIRVRVNLHKQLYSSPIKDLLWEEVLSRSLKDIGVDNDWKPDNNHAQGKDMTLETKERISCKTGSWNSKGTLTISGSRLTKHKTLRDKINFISNKKEDSYVLLSRSNKDKTGENYKLIMFSSDILNYGDMNWKGQKSYKASNELLECSIQHSMSDQLWTKIKNFEQQEKIICVNI